VKDKNVYEKMKIILTSNSNVGRFHKHEQRVTA